MIGKRGQYTPVGAYLAADEIVKIAVEHGAQMVHPGMTCFHSALAAVLILVVQATVSCPRTPSSPARSSKLDS